MIYLDNAATTWPKPEAVYETLGSFLRTAGANPGRAGHRMAADAASAIAACRLRMARLLNAPSPERIIFTSGATEGLNLAISGLVRPGDRVATTTMEHNSVARPLRSVEERGAEVRKIGVKGGVLDLDALQEAAAGSRLLAITHASNVNGAVQPIAECATIAHEAGALLLVDASQTAGTMPIDVQALNVDVLAIPGHKGLLGPPGTGALYLGPRVPVDQLQPSRSGGTGFRSEEDRQPDELPYRYESGTGNTVGIAALGAALEYLERRGVSDITRHESGLVGRLIAGLAEIEGVTVYGAENAADQAAVISLTVEGWQPSDVGAVLDQSFDIACRTGLHCAPDACRTLGVYPGGTVRLSPGPFSSEDDIDVAIAAVAEIASSPFR
ncbi:MAG TPA: cysteine desulfurase [Thermomicrobiales bacterium]|nr:cysteine desulfurase [Thermomicrobiales bacterium]